MIAIITDLWEKSDFNFVKEYVFAHQDDLARPLSMLETLNCRMDTLANDIAQEEIRIPKVGSLLRNSVGFANPLFIAPPIVRPKYPSRRIMAPPLVRPKYPIRYST